MAVLVASSSVGSHLPVLLQSLLGLPLDFILDVLLCFVFQ